MAASIRYTLLGLALAVATAAAGEAVKKSRSGLCHCPGGAYYARTRHFDAFDDVARCLDSGGREPKRGQGICDGTTAAYDRARFGSWADTDGDCRNTRHEILADRSTIPPETEADGCRIRTGRWRDPYTGTVVHEARRLDIDHRVPLAWAWDRGARDWPPDRRRRFANDPSNLVAVLSGVNRRKGASGPTVWLPPDIRAHCPYLRRFDGVVRTYGLTPPPAETAEIAARTRRACAP